MVGFEAINHRTPFSPRGQAEVYRLQGDLDKEGDLKQEVFPRGFMDGSDEFEPWFNS